MEGNYDEPPEDVRANLKQILETIEERKLIHSVLATTIEALS